MTDVAHDDDMQQRLVAVLARPENACCADCNAPSPKWATITHGGFICTQCAGVHRSLGVHISFVLSCTLDKWTDTQLLAVEQGGNAALNARFEAAPTVAKPRADASRSDREQFIRAKYETQAFSPINQQQPPIAAAIAAASSTSLSTLSLSSSSQHTHGMVEYVGVLVIELVEGAALAGMDINGKSDPYVTLHLGDQSITSARVANSVNPSWHETLLLSWDGRAPLVLDVMDHNPIQADRSMGRVVVDTAHLALLLGGGGGTSSSTIIDAWFPVAMPREWATSFSDHLVAGAEGLGRGVYKGITGVWRDPMRGAKQQGLEGFAKGVGRGVAGIVYRPIKGIGSMVKQTALSVGAVHKKHRARGSGSSSNNNSNSEGWEGDDLIAAGAIHLKLSLQRF